MKDTPGAIGKGQTNLLKTFAGNTAVITRKGKMLYYKIIYMSNAILCSFKLHG